MEESVHLCNFPLSSNDGGVARDLLLEKQMESAQIVVSLGHGLRKEHKLKVRQPLARAYLASGNQELLDSLKEQQQLIADELNVKEIIFSTEEEAFVSLKAKPNFRILGKKVGKSMKAAHAAIDAFDQRQLETLLQGGTVDISLSGEPFQLTSEDVEVERIVQLGRIAANSGALTIALDTALTEELLMEGLSREIVNKINTMRREADYEVTDRIKVTISTTERVKQCFETYMDYIANEVLAVDVSFVSRESLEDAMLEGKAQQWDLNGEFALLMIERVVL
jgi:isoleucyl-tRNA synthetase